MSTLIDRYKMEESIKKHQPGAFNRIRCMLLLWLSLLLLTMSLNTVHCQPVSDIYQVVLISNLDDVAAEDDRLESLVTYLENVYSPLALVLNGDFSQDPKLRQLVKLAECIGNKPECRMIITQGDRDWADSGLQGWSKVRQTEKAIRKLKFPNVLWINAKGCPGPEIITLDNHLQLIGINTQWFNHPYDKPIAESGDCKIGEADEFYEELEDLIDEHSDQNVLIVGHYPIRSNGPYGGRYPLTDWLFPMPVISGFVTSYKQNVGGPKEINNERYEIFREKFLDILLARNSLVYASGHDRHMEVLRHGENYLLNTGCFGKNSGVKNSRFTVSTSRKSGFTNLIYVPDGEVRSEFWTLDEDNNFIRTDNRILFQAPCEDPIVDIPVNDRFVPCVLELPVLDKMLFEFDDSTTVVANPNYKAGLMRKLFLGDHYRTSWISPVKVPYLNLDKVNDGLIPFSKGGGRQTKSLKLRTKKGQEFVFRSVDKDPTKSLTYDLRNTVIDILLQDQTTTQYPYGALAVPTWLRPLGILHVEPSLFVMPDDPKLGPWRREFGGMLGMLEERPSDRADQVFGGADDIKRSVKMIRQLYKDRDNKINAEEFMKARILDIAIGDWGRHEDNWKWAGYETKKGMTFRPIPRDRDHVFSKWDGFLPWLADREWAKESGEHFNEDIKDMRSLTWQNRHMDRFLLSEMSKNDWLTAAREVNSIFTYTSIDQALKQLPEQIGNKNIPEISRKLKNRSSRIESFAQRYYNLLAKEVDVVGSNKHELFDVQRHEDGSVEVNMYKLKDREQKVRYYQRTFYPDETREIRLFGLHGSDVFHIAGQVQRSIPIRVIPGGDVDTIVDLSDVRSGRKMTRLYIKQHETDAVTAGNETYWQRHATDEAYDYDRQQFKYNTYFPLVYLFYNSDRGFDIGSQVTFTRYRYGKEDYGSKHRVKARISSNGNIALRYQPRWNDVFGKWDVIGKVEYQKNRNFNYYFGKGLTASYDEDLLASDYYTFRYSMFETSLGLSREFWKHAEASLLFTGYYNTDQENDHSIAADFPDMRGLKSRFNTQLELMLDLDLRDRNDLPRTGYRFLMDSKIGTDVQSEAGSFLSGSVHIEIFNTFHPFTLGIRGGGAVNEGDVPYFLMQYLGRNNYLRGYRQNRFLGDNMLFFNTELRWELTNSRDTFIPLQFGLKAFLDLGRLYFNSSDVATSDWFSGYGGGVYLVPYKERLVMSLVAGFSKEEDFLLQFKLGKPF